MKTTIITSIALLFASAVLAQTPVNKTIPVAAGQTIRLHFDYPKIVRVSTWEKNEISVTGTANINDGENDDAFVLESSVSGSRVDVSNVIKNMKNLPHRITIIRGGQKITFKTKQDYERYREQNAGGFEQRNEGLDMEITLDIKVPKGVKTVVESVYGMVEIRDFNGPLTVDATYGGVDAAVSERAAGEISAETNYGEIYSNLETKFNNERSRDENFHTFVTAKTGTGPSYSFESKYGNVYLRKPVL